MTGLKLLYTQEQIADVVSRLATTITDEYTGKDLMVIGVLKGGVVFMADLVRKIDLPLEFDFIGLASYGDSVTSCGQVKVTAHPTTHLEGRHILVVEDIVDTGLCMAALLDVLKEQHPASVKICALLDKPERRRTPVEVDYTGFVIPDEFVVGYGLDCAQRYRNLPEIYILEKNNVE